MLESGLDALFHVDQPRYNKKRPLSPSHLLPKTMPFRYSSPLTQIIIVGFICFCSPGMFNALNGTYLFFIIRYQGRVVTLTARFCMRKKKIKKKGLGAGGRIGADVSLSDKANAALYTTFAVVGFLAGSVNNVLGPKITLFVRPLFCTC